MCVKISISDLPRLFERLGSCVTVLKPLVLVVTEVYDVIKLLESLKFIQISDGTQLWKCLFEELVQSSDGSNGAVFESADLSYTHTARDPEAIAANNVTVTKKREDSEIYIKSFSDSDSRGHKLVEQSAEEVVWTRDDNDSLKEQHNDDDNDDDDDVVVIEVGSAVKSTTTSDDSWGPFYHREDSPGDNDSFELFIMEVKQKQKNIKSTPCPVATTQRSTDSRYFTAKSVITGLQSDDEEDHEKKNLFEEIRNSVYSRRSLSHRRSFTHVTITDDCIEAEEYLEDSVSSAVTNDGDLAKRLFSEDDEATLSPSQPASKEVNFLLAPSCTPVSIMENLKSTYSSVNFNKFKEKMARDLFNFYNVAVFDSKLSGDFEMTWNVHLTKTAGLCYYSQVDNVKTARIELSTKVCTDFERLRDVLIHELCHAATWVIDGVKCGHGLQWKNWTQKACQIIPGLPTVSTCHQYHIQTKHTYHCTRCDYSIGRHSKSINLSTERCPLCTSQLKLQPKLKADGTPRKQIMSPFAQFVKANYSLIRKQTPDHRQVMSKLATMYKNSTL